MTHPRLLAANERVALKTLEGQVSADRFVDGQMMQVAEPVADILRKPEGGLDRQLLRGDGFLVLEADIDQKYHFGVCHKDGYVGYIDRSHLWPPVANTHKVTAMASHIYEAPDMKTRPLGRLSLGSRVAVSGESRGFVSLIDGTFVPKPHLNPLHAIANDFVSVAESFVGVPYLWGGDSVWGIDCSGLIQMALHASGQKCPRDTDMQVADMGAPIAPDTQPARGDLVFWKGHVGVMSDMETLVHANAFHMAVKIEPLDQAKARISDNGDGDIIAINRPGNCHSL